MTHQTGRGQRSDARRSTVGIVILNDCHTASQHGDVTASGRHPPDRRIVVFVLPFA